MKAAAFKVDAVFFKGAYSSSESGFEGADEPDEQGTALADCLRARGVEHVDVVGIATDHCVRATALDAVKAGSPRTRTPGLLRRRRPRHHQLDPGRLPRGGHRRIRRDARTAAALHSGRNRSGPKGSASYGRNRRHEALVCCAPVVRRAAAGHRRPQAAGRGALRSGGVAGGPALVGGAAGVRRADGIRRSSGRGLVPDPPLPDHSLNLDRPRRRTLPWGNGEAEPGRAAVQVAGHGLFPEEAPLPPRDPHQDRESGGDELPLAVRRFGLGLLVRQ
ncbi:isochorismatase family protein [Streptomyces anulatus]|uniref:isochorismatase family protein n=1 Tax=Streptomyces anulatus TaxID=1892 RepID=UPI00368BF7FD